MPYICRHKTILISVTTFPEIKPQIFIDFEEKKLIKIDSMVWKIVDTLWQYM